MSAPATITISGFHVDDYTESLSYHLELASQNEVTLFSNNDCPSAPTGYACQNSPDLFRAFPQGPDGQGYFDNEFGRIVLYLGGTMTAGDYHTFQFQLRNPVCNQTEVSPCIRANRIMKSCKPASIVRSLMSVDAMSTVGMDRVSYDVYDDVPDAQPGEALPLLIREPVISMATIHQSSAYPCDTNTLTIMLDTDVPLLADLQQNITISGLMGMKNGQGVSMAGPDSGSIALVSDGGVVASSGMWDLEAGTLVVSVVSNSPAGMPFGFSFDLINPSSSQDCAEVYVSISGMCFQQVMLETAESSMYGTDLPYQGACTGFNTSTLPVDASPDSFAGYRSRLDNGRCPLMVVEPTLHTTYVSQSSQYPCTENTITVVIASNVPLDLCSPSLNLTGLDGTMTNSTMALDVAILQPAASTITGEWDVDGVLELDVAAVVPDVACSVFSFSFELKNQMEPRAAADVSMTMKGMYDFMIDVPTFTIPSTYSTWYVGLPGLSGATGFADPDESADPLYVLEPEFTVYQMGQTSPWPADLNTLTLTLATNVPLTPDCSIITISNLEGACATDGPLAMPPTVSIFEDLDGTADFGTWVGEDDDLRGIVIGSMTFVPQSRTTVDTEYVLEFEVRNPVAAQNSPAIAVSASGIPFGATLVNKDLTTVLANPCTNSPLVCEFDEGDAAPLLVYGPTFLQKDVSQSMPYPLKQNTITVTLLSNIPLSEGSLVTISNLKGGQTPTDAITITPENGEDFQSGVGAATNTGSWDYDAKKLTVRVGTEIGAGTEIAFSFVLENPAQNDETETCGYEYPNVCVRASRISTPCLDCTQGQCVTLARQAMDPDFAQIFVYGSLGTWLYGQDAHYDPSALVTYGVPEQGDAYPFNIYAPHFIHKNIVQDNYYPGANNTLSVQIATTVPLIAGTKLTLTGLTGSATEDDDNFMLATASVEFDMTAEWTNAGTLVVDVIADTIAGSLYNFTFVLENPDCDQPAVAVTIRSDLCDYWGAEVMDQDTTLLGLFEAETSWSATLYVVAPSFELAEVWQNNPFPGDSNDISVKFQTNVDLLVGTTITVSGLSAAVASSTPAIIGVTGGSVFPASGAWSAGVLTFTLEEGTVAGDNYEFSFNVENPACCMDAVAVTLNADMFCFTEITADPVESVALLNSVNGGIAAESAPLEIRCPEWVTSTAVQSTSNPCSDNVITVTLQVNVPILDGTMITLTGFTDTLTEGALSLSGTYNGVTATFDPATGEIVLETDTDVDAETDIEIEFTVINPVQPVDVKLLDVTVEDICTDVTKRLAQNQLVTQPGDGVIYVEMAEFEVSMIGQKTPWPGADNVITVTLQSNVPLEDAAPIRCTTTITLAGFDGACIEDDVITLSGADAASFGDGSAFWNDDTKTLTMNVTGDVTAESVFSFALRNPTDAQPSPLIEVEASGIPIAVVRVDKDDSSLPNSYYDHNRWDADLNISWWNDTGVVGVGSTNGAVFESVDLDAQPLNVHAPAFIVRDIGQTSPYPGANNTLMVTIRPNLDLSVGSVITISVLEHEDGTTSGASGPIPLFDLDANPPNASRWNGGMSTENDEWYFAASQGGDPGYGLWNDDSKTLTMFVVTQLTAGSFYSFMFTLKNPLCGQDAQPVCIRARNLKVGCEEGVVIPRRLMDGDAGNAAPLYVISPVITTSDISHSTPWPSETNTLTIALETNVPLLMKAFSPSITLSNLIGTQTDGATIDVTFGGMAVTADWNQLTGVVLFEVPMDTDADVTYTLTFDLMNKNCSQASPDMTVNIDGVCFPEADLVPQTLTVCSGDSEPLQVIGGPCSGASTGAVFTLSSIAQSTPNPSCDNTITVTFKTNIPLTGEAAAKIIIDFDDTLVIGLDDGTVTLASETQGIFDGEGEWNSATNELTLSVVNGESLDACVEYVVSFVVVNPWEAQSALPVAMYAKGNPDGKGEVDIVVSVAELDTENDVDEHPMQVDDPTFLVKNIAQSSPYPGGDNTLTVTFSLNTNLQVGAQIVIHNIIGAEAEEGDIALTGGDNTYFESLDETANSGTWDNCEKALILVVAQALGCGEQEYVLSFDVMNPLHPQLCADVLINASNVEVPNPFNQDPLDITESNQASRDNLQFIWDGYDMDPETQTAPTDIFGAMGQDSCPMTVWPAAFVVKSIGQSLPYPCAPNDITVTLATNVPLYPVIQYPNSRDPIQTKIIVSRLLVQAESATALDIDTFVVDGNDPVTLFTDTDDTDDKATWESSNSVYPDESSVTLHLKDGANDECCIPEDGDDMTIKFTFEVTNPAQAQDPSVPVSISAVGIPIVESAMQMGFGDFRPLYLKQLEMTTKMIAQSTSGPCAENTITVTLQPNINLYVACSPLIFISALSDVDLTPYVDLGDLSPGGTFNSTAEWDSGTSTLH
eukprot:3935902-Rhodomonas_salina.2